MKIVFQSEVASACGPDAVLVDDEDVIQAVAARVGSTVRAGLD